MYFHCDRVLRPEFYAEYQEPLREGQTIYSTGSASPRKGLGLLLEAVAVLAQDGFDGVQLRVSGAIEGSPIWPILRRRAERLGVNDRVRWLGPLDAAEVRRELQSCTVYAHPAFMDNSPNALAEAMITGAACVGSTAGGIPSMLHSEVEGLLFETGDAAALTVTLRRVLGDQDLRRRLGESARHTAQQRHDPARIADVTMETYAAILREPGNGRC
jgi:glycosyltransferase involved in cell wall biosynthesis